MNNDFQEFYNNPVIQKIKGNERWTVSTTKSPLPQKSTKMPIDMKMLAEGKIWGASFDRGHNPLVNLDTVRQMIPDATNNTYLLDYLLDNIIVLDVEPTCPEELKYKFIRMPYLYGETSMSGKGLHLIFNVPTHILSKYPNAKEKIALKDEHGYYEILMNHYVTFTRNSLTPSINLLADPTEFYQLFEELAQMAKPTIKNDHIIIDMEDIQEIPYFDEMFNKISWQKYNKTLENFIKDEANPSAGFDNSAYEFGMASFYYRALRRILIDGRYKDYILTDRDKALIIYKAMSDNIEYRSKHDEIRLGMPWLLFIATSLIAQYSN